MLLEQNAVAWGWSCVKHQCHAATSAILIVLRAVGRLGCMRTFAKWQAWWSACLGSSVSFLGLHQSLAGNIPQTKYALQCTAVARWLEAVQVLVSLFVDLFCI